MEILWKQFHSISKEIQWYLQGKNDISEYLNGLVTLTGLIFGKQEFMACPMIYQTYH